MENINVELTLNKRVYVNVDIEDVVGSINDLPMTRRFNYIGHLINNIETDIKELTDEQKGIIKKYLKNKLKAFN